jgi:hypothetical protein
VQFNHIASWVVQEGLPAGSHHHRVAHLDAPFAQFGDRGVEIVDLQRKMLTLVRRNTGPDQVDLLIPRIEPGPRETEVWPVRARLEAQRVDVEGEGRVDIVDVDRNVMYSHHLHDNHRPVIAILVWRSEPKPPTATGLWVTLTRMKL